MVKPFRLVEGISLGRHHDLRTQSQIRIVSSKLTVDDFVIVTRIAARSRRHVNQMKQQLCALNESHKPIDKSMAFMRDFDQTGDVGDYKRAKVAGVDHAQMRLKRRKRIVSDLWPGG